MDGGPNRRNKVIFKKTTTLFSFRNMFRKKLRKLKSVVVFLKIIVSFVLIKKTVW